MAEATDTPTTAGAGAGAGAGASATSDTTSETAAVVSSTTKTTTAAPADQTTQTNTPPAAEIASSSSSGPTVLSDPVTSSSGTSVSQVSLSQHTTTTITSSYQVPSSLPLSTTPVATASATATPVPTTNHGLGTGAVVGIAVGCAVAGLITGVLAAFFLLKRRAKSYPEAELVETCTGEKGFDSRAFTATPVEPPLAASDLDQFLLAPMPDKELAGELQSLGHLIEQHVEDHYHLFPVQQSTSSLSQALAELGLAADTEALPAPAQLADMLAEPRTRHVALQHVISRVIFESLAVRSASKLSMLPPAVSSLVREMPPCEKHVGNPEAISCALTRWRQISAFLLNPNRSERGSVIPDAASLAPQARGLVVAMSSVLGAFVDKQNRDDQECHLQDVVLECARFGYIVLSQPAELAWVFATGNTEELVLCPGLDKVSDSRGVGCRAEVIRPPEVHRV